MIAPVRASAREAIADFFLVAVVYIPPLFRGLMAVALQLIAPKLRTR
jgi:hypothetical protein